MVFSDLFLLFFLSSLKQISAWLDTILLFHWIQIFKDTLDIKLK